jgi:hypothetical protein
MSIPDLKNRLTAAVCGDHHTWLADQSMAGIGLSPRCVPCDKGCTHWTFVDMYHKLVELLFHFIYKSVHHTCEHNQLPHRSNHFDTGCRICPQDFGHPGGVQLKCDGTRWRTGGEVKGKLANGVLFTLPRNMVYPALLPLMRKPRLPVVDWTDAPADLNGLVHFA